MTRMLKTMLCVLLSILMVAAVIPMQATAVQKWLAMLLPSSDIGKPIT